MAEPKEFAVTALGAFSTDGKTLFPLPKGREIEILEMETEAQRREFGGEILHPGFDTLGAAERNGVGRKEALLDLRRIAFQISGKRMREQVGLDYLLISEINTLDELNVVLNSLSTRLRELWGLYYPEMDASDNEAFARKVSEGALAKPSESIGAHIPEEELEKIKGFASSILALYSEKGKIEKNIDGLSERIAPNLSKVAGGALAARLVAKAGSLGRLASMPSSTMQVLGAEKALFKHLTRGVPCPKHGLIFQHPEIQGAPKEKRGRLARSLSGKLSIAARVDYFSVKIGENAQKQ